MTTCLNVDELRFRVHTLDDDGKAFDTGKEFTITHEFSKMIEKKLYPYDVPRERFMREAIVKAMFNQLFDWPDTNGFCFTWRLSYKSAYISWRKNNWLLTRIV